MTTPSEESSASQEHWLELVREKVGAIRFGSVQITVHDGRVTLVEAIEKMRIDPDRAPSSPQGVKAKKKL